MISARDLLGVAATHRYDENGEPAYSAAERILLALRWHDWIEPSDLYDQFCESETHERQQTQERNTYQAALYRLISSGRVERRAVEHYSEAVHRIVETVYVRLSPNVTKPRGRARA